MDSQPKIDKVFGKFSFVSDFEELFSLIILVKESFKFDPQITVLRSKYWHSIEDVFDRAKISMNILSVISLFVDQIYSFF